MKPTITILNTVAGFYPITPAEGVEMSIVSGLLLMQHGKNAIAVNMKTREGAYHAERRIEVINVAGAGMGDEAFSTIVPEADAHTIVILNAGCNDVTRQALEQALVS